MKCSRCLSDNIRYVGTCVDDEGETELAYHCEDCQYNGCEADGEPYDEFPQDEGRECTMCGKPVVYMALEVCVLHAAQYGTAKP